MDPFISTVIDSFSGSTTLAVYLNDDKSIHHVLIETSYVELRIRDVSDKKAADRILAGKYISAKGDSKVYVHKFSSYYEFCYLLMVDYDSNNGSVDVKLSYATVQELVNLMNKAHN